jgi:hypothetical protein
MLYGIDLIDPDGKGDVIEYWRGWIAYYNGLSQEHDEELGKLDTIDKAKKLSLDPNSIPLDKWHKTPLNGSELASMESDIKHLSDILNSTEYSLLDEYKDEDETEEQATNRSIYEKYDQYYAILKNPKERHLSDGILKNETISLTRVSPIFGYKGDGKYDVMGAKAPLEIITNNRETIISNLYILYAFTKWRLKTGELLGVNKTDEFISMTEHLDPIDLHNSYEVYRSLLVDSILSEAYILPEYRKYTDMLVEAYKPIGDISEDASYRQLLNKTGGMEGLYDLVESIYKRDKSVTKALEIIEGMTIYNIKDSFYEIKDALAPILESKRAGNG